MGMHPVPKMSVEKVEKMEWVKVDSQRIKYDIPYSKEFGGTRSDGQPFTGNGYTGSAEHVIPEYVSNGTTPSSGEIYRVNPDGTEEAVAYYDPKEKVFSLYD